MEFINRTKERQEVADHMHARGYGVLVQRPPGPRPGACWYGAMANGRLVVTTITRRRVATGNLGDTPMGLSRRRHQNVAVLTIMMAAQVTTPFGFGIHTHFGSLAGPTLEEVFPTDHPAHGLPLGLKQAFHTFARGLVPPGQSDHRRYARHTRIVDTHKIADWLPPGIFQGTSVLTVHDLPLDNGWQSRFDNAVNGLGWIAHAIETAASEPSQ